MKKILCVALLFCCVCFGSFAQEAQPLPKRGSLKGGTTKVHNNIELVRGQKDDFHYAFIILDQNQSAIDIGFMSNKHKSCSLYAPKGQYQLIVAYGNTWYGVKKLFGAEGTYLKTDFFEIEKSNKTYQITVNAKDAEIPAYALQLEDILYE
ncbi:MAG: hypothetical protein SPL05_05590 [Eubacteriales bacterium]|nr:hypothetical protein [Eubacteriales bacterium]